jgi:SAM-dependent methyltransferase
MTNDEKRGFYGQSGLNASTFDLRYKNKQEEVDFYVKLSEKIQGPILDIGSGTGAIALRVASEYTPVFAIEKSKAMIGIMQNKLEGSPKQKFITPINQDISDYDTSKRFSLIIAPFHVMQNITDRSILRDTIRKICQQLQPDGLFAFNIFSPDLDWLRSSNLPEDERFETWSTGDKIYECEIVSRHLDLGAQILHEDWRFRELDQSGDNKIEEIERLTYTWFYRFEILYLLELCGFKDIKEYGGYAFEPYEYGEEHVILARR